MKKWIQFVLLSLFPMLVFADDSTLSFAPPSTDNSVVFLGNLFGVVDGVLSGTGSQIMGSLFAVLNSAVLAVGGIIIMYTMMVATMNTAHEGQMLGQKWSSIWIPVRSTLGLALLIPKASGYCLMQIFVMWVVVQGVGAADKIWDAALGYLNRGGVIVQAQSNTSYNLTQGNIPADIPTAAENILIQNVCMLGLQKQLTTIRQYYLKQKQSQTGPCVNPSGAMMDFCNTAVPDFIGSVNAVAFQNQALQNNPSSPNFTMLVPNFTTTPYSNINGICGKLIWNNIPSSTLTALSVIAGISLTQDEGQSLVYSRATAIQQMIVDLTTVAQTMVNNDPQITPNTATPYSVNAVQQFGVPYNSSGTLCAKITDNCNSWGPLSSGGGTLFTGTEFLSAVNDYNGIMAPTLNLFNQAAQGKNAASSRAFITQASANGWIMAGSYFFDLVALNGNAVNSSQQTDTTSGLNASVAGFGGLATGSSSGGGGTTCNPTYSSSLCTWITPTALPTSNNTNINYLIAIQSLIDGTYTASGPTGPQGTAVSKPNMGGNNLSTFQLVSNSFQDSSVYGFINNEMMVIAPGQPGTSPLTFAKMMTISVNPDPNPMPDATFDCGTVKIVFFTFCLGRLLGKILYNSIVKTIMNWVMGIVQQLISQIIMAFLTVPLSGIATIFQQGVTILTQPGINPVVALAQMGTFYINFASNLWLNLLTMIVSPFFIILIPMYFLCLPLLLGWLSVMVGVGFVTAYYVPILPYTIFIFGALAWLISVIEAMAAAPIVALGVTHPEGHDAFGKGEAAIMLLMNVFLRPALMIIGFISGTALCYVGVWLLNAGFDHAISFIQNGGANAAAVTGGFLGLGGAGGTGLGLSLPTSATGILTGPASLSNPQAIATQGAGTGTGENSGGYSDWAGIYALFFSVLIYTSMYLTIVQQAFSLISILPDKVLRWIGGTPESVGQESARWGEEMKGQAKEAGKVSSEAQGQIQKSYGAAGLKAIDSLKSGAGKATASGESTPSPPEGKS